MSILAIRLLGLLHGAAGLIFLLLAAVAPNRPEGVPMPRGKLYYVVGKLAFAGLALLACAFAAWLRPSIAWAPAALSLLTYAPGPTWAKLGISSGQFKVVPPDTVSSKAINLRRNSIIGLAVRAAFVVLLAVAGNAA